jgi:hypothetical protein
MRRPTFILALSSTFLIVLAACGDSDSSSTPELTLEEFQTRANEICSTSIVNIGFYLGGFDFDQNPLDEQQMLDKVILLTREYVVGISELEPPKDIASKVESLLTRIENATDELEQSGPESFFGSQDDPFDGYNSQYRSQFEELGLYSCLP